MCGTRSRHKWTNQVYCEVNETPINLLVIKYQIIIQGGVLINNGGRDNMQN